MPTPATKNYGALTAVLAGNLDDTALVPVYDKNSNTRKATVAQLRTQLLLAGAASIGKIIVGDGTVAGGFGAAGTLGIVSAISNATTGGVLNGNFYTKQTGPSSGTIQGVEGYAHLAHTTGTVAQALAVIGNLEVSGTGGTTTTAVGVTAGGIMTAGTVTTWVSLQAAGPGAVTGTISTLIGLRVLAQELGVVNWAIYCPSSATSGGVTFRTTALATAATVGHLFIPSCAGVPTGVPANIPAGQVAFQYDSTNNQVYVYNGAWKKTVALT